MTEKIELKQCPFCGARAEWCEDKTISLSRAQLFFSVASDMSELLKKMKKCGVFHGLWVSYVDEVLANADVVLNYKKEEKPREGVREHWTGY